MFAKQCNEIFYFQINDVVIVDTSKKLKSNKACSCDSVSNEILKCIVHNELSVLLTFLFSNILSSLKFSRIWKTEYVTPIYKPDASFNPSNYRRTTVTSNFNKLFTLITHERLLKVFDDTKLIC